MATKENRNNETDMRRFHIYLDADLHAELQRRMKAEGFGKMGQFIRYILRKYLKGELNSTGDTQTLERFETLIRKQQEFFANLDALLRNAAKNEPPENYLKKEQRVTALLAHNRMGFGEIGEITQIPEEEILIILGHLYQKGKIAYDEKWRYYLL